MRIAIVTGASSGIGKEMVLQLADHFGGLDEIWIIARRGGLLKRLQPQVPLPIRVFDLDITDRVEISRLDDALRAECPQVKFLVNSAGFGKIGMVGEIDPAFEAGMIRLNCEALCTVTQMVLPYMTANGRIIQIASAAAFLPQPKFAVYAATKAFVLSYSRSLGQELKKRSIYVTAVCPGPVKTEFFDIAQTTGKIPLYKRLAMADTRRVVQQAIHDSIMKKPISVYGITMKLFFILCKIVPHEILLTLIGYF